MRRWRFEKYWQSGTVILVPQEEKAAEKDLNRNNDVKALFTAAVALTSFFFFFFQMLLKGRAERMHPKTGLPKRRYYSCTSLEIWQYLNILEKNATFYVHWLENVWSCGESFGIYLDATSCKSKRTEQNFSAATFGESAEHDKEDREIRHCLQKRWTIWTIMV